MLGIYLQQAFLHGHVNNLSLKESLDKGTEMSSRVIQQIGARLKLKKLLFFSFKRTFAFFRFYSSWFIFFVNKSFAI